MELINEEGRNLTYFYVKNSTKNPKELQLLGFKDGKAVLGEITMASQSVNIDAGEKGAKFITINGTKIKVIVTGKLKDLTNVNTPSTSSSSNDNKDKMQKTDIKPVVLKPSTSVADKNLTKIFKPNFLNIVSKIKKSQKTTMTSTACQTFTKTYKEKAIQTDSIDLIDLFDTNLDLLSENINMPGESIDTILKVESPEKKILPSQNVLNDKNNPRVKIFLDVRNCMNFNSNGNLPIHEAVLDNNINNVKRFALVLKSLGNHINLLNQDKYSPLQVAILSEAKKEIVAFFIQNGADLSLTDSEGNTVFHLAVQLNNYNALEELCKCERQKHIVDQFNYEGVTPLMICCINQNLNCAEILLDSGAKPDIKDKKSGRTALFHAAENQHYEMVKLLLDHNANTKIKNFFGTSPHDAMFEMDEIPQGIRNLIWLSKKRKAAQAQKTAQLKNEENFAKKLKIVKTYQKIPKPT